MWSDGKNLIENSFCDKKLGHLIAAFLLFSASLVPLEKRRDRKNNDEKKRRDKKLGDLMPALFLRYFDQQQGSLTLPKRIA